MVEQVQTAWPGIVVESKPTDIPGYFKHTFSRLPGKDELDPHETSIETDDTPDDLKKMWVNFDNDEKSDFYTRHIFEQFVSEDKRHFIQRVIEPNIRAIPANIAGIVPDLISLALMVPLPKELIQRHYEEAGDPVPWPWLSSAEMKKEREEKSAAFAEYGTVAQRKRLQRFIRIADKHLEEQDKPPWFSIIFGGTDITPDPEGYVEKVVSSGMEFGLSGAAEMKAFSELAGGTSALVRLIKNVATPGRSIKDPVQVKNILDKWRDFYSSKTPEGTKRMREELGAGFTAAGAYETLKPILEEVGPESPLLQEMFAMAGAIAAPGLVRFGKNTALKSWGAIPTPSRALRRGIIEPMFKPTATAARFQATMGAGALAGSSSKTTQERYASTMQILEKAVEERRHLDEASGLAFTTPELSRTEAARLAAASRDLKARLSELDPTAREASQVEINKLDDQILDLRQFANFQDAIIRSAYERPDSSRFWADQTQKLLERRDQIFDMFERQFKRPVEAEGFQHIDLENIDYGGIRGGSADELKIDYDKVIDSGDTPQFYETRRRLVMEANLQGRAPSELKFLSEEAKTKVADAFEDTNRTMDDALLAAQEAAQERLNMWHDGIKTMLEKRGLSSVDDLPSDERRFVGKLIRDTYADAQREFSLFEKAAWKRIKGLDTKVEDNIVFPQGAVDHKGADISGLTPEEFAVGWVEALSPQTKFKLGDLPVQLAHLMGEGTLAKAMRKGDPEAEARDLQLKDIQKQIKAISKDYAKQKRTDEVAVTTAEARPTPVAKLGPTLLEFISERGGIRSTGELRDLDLGEWHKGKPGKKKLLIEETDVGPALLPGEPAKPKAGSWEEMFEAAHDDGYFPELAGKDIRQIDGEAYLLEKISSEAKGDPVRTLEDQEIIRAMEGDADFTQNVWNRAEDLDITVFTPAGKERPLNRILQDVKDAEARRGMTIEESFDFTEAPLSEAAISLRKEENALRAELGQMRAALEAGIPMSPEDLAEFLPGLSNKGRLASRDFSGELIEGISAQDVTDVISDIAERLRVEQGKKVPNKRLMANLTGLRSTLEQLLDPRVFSTLDPADLRLAKEASTISRRAESARGDVLRKKGAEPVIAEEMVPEKVLERVDRGGRQAAQIRAIDTATQQFSNDLISIEYVKDADTGMPVLNDFGQPVQRAVFNEDALIGGESLFELEGVPFTKQKIGDWETGASEKDFTVVVDKEYAPTPQALEVVESILLNELGTWLPKGLEINTKNVQKFKSQYQNALTWLDQNGRSDLIDMMTDTENLTAAMDVYNRSLNNQTLRQFKILEEKGLLHEGVNAQDMVDYFTTTRKRIAGDKALQSVFGADPGYATTSLVDRVLKSNHPDTEIENFLSVIRDNETATDGFKAALISDLWARATSSPDPVAKQTGELLGTNIFDPTKFRELISDPNIRKLLQKTFPNNPALLPGLTKLASTATEVGPYGRITPESQLAVIPTDFVSQELWSNLGRVSMLTLAAKTKILNALWAAGLGGRLGKRLGQSLTLHEITDLVVEAALNPQEAVKLGKINSPEVFSDLYKRLILPRGTTLEVLTEPAEDLHREEDPELELRGFPYGWYPQRPGTWDPGAILPTTSGLQPPAGAPAPPRQYASLTEGSPPAFSALESSTLGQVSPIKMAGREVFGPNDPVFGAHGGSVSACPPKKPRQMVS